MIWCGYLWLYNDVCVIRILLVSFTGVHVTEQVSKLLERMSHNLNYSQY